MYALVRGVHSPTHAAHFPPAPAHPNASPPPFLFSVLALFLYLSPTVVMASRFLAVVMLAGIVAAAAATAPSYDQYTDVSGAVRNMPRGQLWQVCFTFFSCQPQRPLREKDCGNKSASVDAVA